MAKMLLQTKRDYMDYVSKYMHENHISFKTPEQTKQTWRAERAYDPTIEAELISISKLFFSLLRCDLNLDFRRRLANFMASYLSVYTSKSKEYDDITDARTRQERAYAKLNNKFLLWLDSIQKIKADHKAGINQKAQKIHTGNPEQKYKKRVLRHGGKVVQEITIGSEKISFTYEDLTEYRKKYRADLANAISAHTK